MNIDPVFGADRYARYANLRADAPVERIKTPPGTPGPAELWLVSRHDDVVAALHDAPLHLEQPPQYQFGIRTLLNTDPPDHTRLRRVVSGLFTRKRIQSLRIAVQAIADDLIDHLPAGETIDFIERFAVPLPITVICQMLGIPADDWRLFREWTPKIFNTDEESVTTRPAAVAQLIQYMGGLVRTKRDHPADDVTTTVIQNGKDVLSEQELLSTLMLLLIAGHETTVNLLGNGLLALIQHPDQLELLRSDPARTPDAVEELLRYDSPVSHATIRYASEDLTIAGVRIAAGEGLLLALGSANHDPALVSEADDLNVHETATSTWPSDRACTTAWARHWPDWKANSRSTRYCADPPRFPLPWNQKSCNGGSVH
nr:cytochrome P450 [Fodinicola feengrottensis]